MGMSLLACTMCKSSSRARHARVLLSHLYRQLMCVCACVQHTRVWGFMQARVMQEAFMRLLIWVRRFLAASGLRYEVDPINRGVVNVLLGGAPTATPSG